MMEDFDYSGVDRKEIPRIEKEKGNKSYLNGDYFEALRHFSKVHFSISVVVIFKMKVLFGF